MNPRYISALIAIPIFLLVILLGSAEVISILLAVAMATAAFEWSKLIDIKKEFVPIYCIAVFIFIALACWIFFNALYSLKYAVITNSIMLLLLVFWLFIMPCVLFYQPFQKYFLNNKFLLKLAGIGIFIAFANGFLFTWERLGGIGVCAVFALIWLSDGAAYFCGKAWGRHKFSAKISPNKTWEGFAGGWFFSVLGGLIFAYFFSDKLSTYYILLLVIISACYAPLGDLFESLLKRHKGVKDSGNLMPGHGGILDRIDSWLPVLTIWGSGIYLFKFLGLLG